MAHADASCGLWEEVALQLQASLSAHRQLRRVQGRLLCDALAVAAGARPVAMLDYVHGMGPAQLAAALEPLRLAPSFQGCILTLDSCCYVCHLPDALDATRWRLQLPADFPLLLTWQPSGGWGLADSDSELTLRGQLQVLLQTLEELQAAPQPWPLLDMDTLQGPPCMPTLNGWLLGYPAVYLVHSREEAAALSTQLSRSRLRLSSVLLPCGAARGAGARGAAPPTRPAAVGRRCGTPCSARGAAPPRASTPPPQGAPAANVPSSQHASSFTLLSFSVPEQLHDSCLDERLMRMVHAMRARLEDRGWPVGAWGAPRVVSEWVEHVSITL